MTGDRATTWTPVDVADVVLGSLVVALEASRRVTARARVVARPLAAVASGPLAVARRLRQESPVVAIVERGERQRRAAAELTYGLGQRLAPRIVEGVLGLVDLNAVVPGHLDLDALVADVDVDAVVARVDLQRVIDRIDVDAIVARADLEAVLGRVDVDDVVARVDLQRVVDRIDVDAIVARADLEAVLGRVDVDDVVARVDLQRVIDRIDVDAVVGRADLDAVVAKLDLIALAEFVVDGIDLPGIIRSSTGSMASEGLREVRRQGIGADERVAHVVDRLLGRPVRTPGSMYEAIERAHPDRRSRPPGPGDPGLAH